MLHVCQQWSIWNRIQIDTDKTKIIALFETPSILRARGGQHQFGPNMPPFHVVGTDKSVPTHVYSPFLASDLRSYPFHKVYEFEYLGLILDPTLTREREKERE